MRKFYRIVPALVAAALALWSMPAAAIAQTNGGGIIIEGNFGGDPKNLNPLLVSDTASQRVVGFLFTSLIGVDPKTGSFAQGVQGALADKWEVSSDGLTYTIHLKKTYKWSDGQPVTAKDYKFSYDAIVSGKVDSPLTGDTQDQIQSVTAPDDYTVIVTFKAANCKALSFIANITPLPAQGLSTDFTKMNDDPFNTNPNNSNGVFKFKALVPSQNVTLLADQNYPDTLKGSVKPDGFIYKVVPDQTVLVEQFLAGETNAIDCPLVSRRADIAKAKDAGKVKVYDYPGNSWDYIAWNEADPTNPQSAVDDKGNPTNLDQGHHPLFGDPQVRKALALGTNVDQMIKTAVFGQGTRMASGIIPASWAYDPSLKPLPFDVDTAGKMLDAAGFPKGADGLRVAKGAKYAKDGTPFRFTLLTNQGNSRRNAIGTVFQDNMKALGVTVDFQPINFNTLLDRQNAQDYDAILLGWRNGFPDDPDQSNLFTPTGDIVGSGYNFTSYNNPAFTKLQQDALHVAGCGQTDRAALYAKAQKILQDDQPYMFLFVVNGEYAVSSNVQGFDPLPSQFYWNVDSWTVKSN